MLDPPGEVVLVDEAVQDELVGDRPATVAALRHELLEVSPAEHVGTLGVVHRRSAASVVVDGADPGPARAQDGGESLPSLGGQPPKRRDLQPVVWHEQTTVDQPCQRRFAGG